MMLKSVCLGRKLTRQQFWRFVPILLLPLSIIGSISANQSVPNRLVRQNDVGQVAKVSSVQIAPHLEAQSTNLDSKYRAQQKQQRQVQVPTTTSTSSPPKLSPPEAPTQLPVVAINKQKMKSNSRNSEQNQNQKQQQCEYEKEAWQACQSNGCKYARGEWSNSCIDGLRVRTDTLVGYANPNEYENLIFNGQLNANRTLNSHNRLDHSSTPDKLPLASNFSCQSERKVTKDCRRACHYIKSAWSDCINGFKTRNLTLDETPLLENTTVNSNDNKTDAHSLTITTIAIGASTNKQSKLLSPTGSGCTKQKQVRRECRRGLRELQNVAASAFNTKKLTQTSSNSSMTTGKLADRRTPAQKKRLKQLQRQQQQQQKEKERTPVTTITAI